MLLSHTVLQLSLPQVCQKLQAGSADFYKNWWQSTVFYHKKFSYFLYCWFLAISDFGNDLCETRKCVWQVIIVFLDQKFPECKSLHQLLITRINCSIYFIQPCKLTSIVKRKKKRKPTTFALNWYSGDTGLWYFQKSSGNFLNTLVLEVLRYIPRLAIATSLSCLMPYWHSILWIIERIWRILLFFRPISGDCHRNVHSEM